MSTEFLANIDGTMSVRLLLLALLVASFVLLVAAYAQRRRRAVALRAIAASVDQLMTGTGSGDGRVPQDRSLGPLPASLEAFMAYASKRDAAALEATSTNRVMARELKRLTRLLDTSSDGMVALDNAQKVLFANHAVAPHFSIPPEASNGKPIRECLRDGRILDLLSGESEESTQESVRTLELAPHADYGHGYLTATLAACNDSSGDSIGQLLVIRDVDEVKTLRRQHIQFVEHLAEEFRVPLTAVRAHAETLAASSTGKDAVVGEACAAIRNEGRRLSLLLDNLVILSRIECGAAHADVDAVPLKGLLEAIVESVSPECTKKGVTLTANLPERLPTLYADETLLRVALMNILTNAVQYTQTGGTITVETASHEEDIQVSFRDTGCGIHDDRLESIFQKFYRCPESDKVPGSGIGLAVARQIVRLHGGDIDVSSHVGHGSQFTIILPRTLLQAKALDAPAA